MEPLGSSNSPNPVSPFALSGSPSNRLHDGVIGGPKRQARNCNDSKTPYSLRPTGYMLNGSGTQCQSSATSAGPISNGSPLFLWWLLLLVMLVMFLLVYYRQHNGQLARHRAVSERR